MHGGNFNIIPVPNHKMPLVTHLLWQPNISLVIAKYHLEDITPISESLV